MIVYQSTKRGFLHDALERDIEEVVAAAWRERTGGGVAPAEFRAWSASLLQMAKVLRDDGIPDACGVAVEYCIPQTAKRVDFILTGRDADDAATAVIVELKQWSGARRSDKDGIVWARRGGIGGETEGAHPSYQAWSYAALLKGFNEAVHRGDVELQPCAYLHNYVRDGEIDHAFYAPHLERAPLFLKGEQEREKLRAFIRRHVRRGDDGALLYRIEHGRIRPSKSLADSVLGMLTGRPDFVLVDDQKLVFESAMQAAQRAAADGPKQVVLVRGGPGTGKSVVAINLLARLTAQALNVRYVSKNAAPRAVYETKLAGSFRRSEIGNFFSGSGAFTETPADTFDVLVVDEAHRLNERSGLYGNLGENQIKELIGAARCSVFFVDDDQRVTLRDIGHSQALLAWAARFGAQVTELELASQFRCSGSDGYLAWLDDVLGVRPTANERLDPDEFDFRVVDSPAELHALIEERNRVANRARVVAGYCWPWNSKRNPQAWDIVLPEHGYRRRWNLSQDGSLWIIAPESVAEVGCIHTCQGLELDYVGVIVGPDLVADAGRVAVRPKARARSDKSLHGLAALARIDAAQAAAQADRIVRNTYRTLMTRGLKGCYVWCADAALAALLRDRIAPASRPAVVVPPPADVLPFRRVSAAERAAGVHALPLVDLRFAAGVFGAAQTFDADQLVWVEAPDGVATGPGLFVAQVVGNSMDRVIPDGAWCLFRAHPQGTRAGKVVVAMQRAVDDPDLGGRYTVKRYRSEKVADGDGGWRHARIVLSPESSDARHAPIVIEQAAPDDFRVVAELCAVLA